MLVDDIKIEVYSGKGGDGRVHFDSSKMGKGPTGGDGGKGGDVYLEGVSNIGVLSKFRGKKVYYAEDGKPGGQCKKSGKTGEDLVLKVPVGTVAHILNQGKIVEINKIGEKILLAEGGEGGRGNFYFRSPSNTTPKEAEEGKPAIHLELRLELKLIADVGLIGLPNVGKSTLLNKITNAKSRVANFAFTTLEPSLGAYYELILADIPGLIEGASEGKGLGIKFLQHVERTSTFFHLISAQSNNPEKDYQVIRNELEIYNPALLKRKEYVFLSQCDLADDKKIKNNIEKLKKIGLKVRQLSIENPKTIKEAEKVLREVIEDKKV
jgi:GTP-binding protein